MVNAMNDMNGYLVCVFNRQRTHKAAALVRLAIQHPTENVEVRLVHVDNHANVVESFFMNKSVARAIDTSGQGTLLTILDKRNLGFLAGNDTDRVVTLTFNGEDFTPARFGVVVVSRKRKRGDSDAGGGDGGGGGAPGPSFDSQRASDGLQAAEYFCLPDLTMAITLLGKRYAMQFDQSAATSI